MLHMRYINFLQDSHFPRISKIMDNGGDNDSQNIEQHMQ